MNNNTKTELSNMRKERYRDMISVALATLGSPEVGKDVDVRGTTLLSTRFDLGGG